MKKQEDLSHTSSPPKIDVLRIAETKSHLDKLGTPNSIKPLEEVPMSANVFKRSGGLEIDDEYEIKSS